MAHNLHRSCSLPPSSHCNVQSLYRISNSPLACPSDARTVYLVFNGHPYSLQFEGDVRHVRQQERDGLRYPA